MIGAHVSAAGSLEKSFAKALEIGANCTQIFISPPQQWAHSKHDEEEIKKYLEALKTSNIKPNFIHAAYLINLGAKDPEHLKKSVDWLIYAMNLAANMNIEGVIFHTGSHKGEGFDSVLDQIIESIKTIITSSKTTNQSNTPYLIIENTAGAGGTIGKTCAEIGAILKGVNNPRLKICLDTQHIFAGGYDIRSTLGLEKLLTEFETHIGLDNLVVVHANDSKTEFNSGRDRHENIGEGTIGQFSFKHILNHPKLKHLPFILEVPGFENQGPDKQNINILNSLVK